MSILRSVADAVRTPQARRTQLLEVGATAVAVATWPLGLADGPLTLALAGARPRATVPPVDTPVVLVHGFAGSKSNFLALETALRRAGYHTIIRFSYNAFTASLPEIAERLSDCVTELCARSGAERVHLVGHSLGGVVCRYFVTELGGDEVVDTVVTVASPHTGSPLGRLGAVRPGDLGCCALQVACGSPLLAGLDASLDARLAAGQRVRSRFVCYFSDADLVVPGDRAQLHHPAVDAVHEQVDLGHLSVLLSREVADGVTAHLLAAEARPEQVTPLAA